MSGKYLIRAKEEGMTSIQESIEGRGVTRRDSQTLHNDDWYSGAAKVLFKNL